MVSIFGAYFPWIGSSLDSMKVQFSDYWHMSNKASCFSLWFRCLIREPGSSSPKQLQYLSLTLSSHRILVHRRHSSMCKSSHSNGINNGSRPTIQLNDNGNFSFPLLSLNRWDVQSFCGIFIKEEIIWNASVCINHSSALYTCEMKKIFRFSFQNSSFECDISMHSRDIIYRQRSI